MASFFTCKNFSLCSIPSNFTEVYRLAALYNPYRLPQLAGLRHSSRHLPHSLGRISRTILEGHYFSVVTLSRNEKIKKIFFRVFCCFLFFKKKIRHTFVWFSLFFEIIVICVPF